jgi:hypothetical protein
MILEIQSQDHIELYASDAGYCCILQKSYEGEDALILIAPHMVDDVCAMLQKVKPIAMQFRQEHLKEKGAQ